MSEREPWDDATSKVPTHTFWNALGIGLLVFFACAGLGVCSYLAGGHP